MMSDRVLEQTPTPRQLLDEIYRDRCVRDAAGNSHPLHSETTPDEGQLMADVIARHNVQRSLE